MNSKSKTRSSTGKKPEGKKSENGSSRPARSRTPRARNASSLGKGERGDTNRRAAAVLEVLAGMRTPSEAAKALGLSVNYYYVLERKALAGLLAACQPQPKGPPGPSNEQQLARVQQELDKCRQECMRQAALVRATERAIGLSAVSPSSKRGNGKPEDGKKRKRRRRPAVRAMLAAETLRQNSSLEDGSAGVEPSIDERNSSTGVTLDKESCDGTQGTQAAGNGTC